MTKYLNYMWLIRHYCFSTQEVAHGAETDGHMYWTIKHLHKGILVLTIKQPLLQETHYKSTTIFFQAWHETGHVALKA